MLVYQRVPPVRIGILPYSTATAMPRLHGRYTAWWFGELENGVFQTRGLSFHCSGWLRMGFPVSRMINILDNISPKQIINATAPFRKIESGGRRNMAMFALFCFGTSRWPLGGLFKRIKIKLHWSCMHAACMHGCMCTEINWKERERGREKESWKTETNTVERKTILPLHIQM